jgi:AraC-like DNA-binding protein/mannose-6-phosphate isomerase-like protein (cupin superfamily)
MQAINWIDKPERTRERIVMTQEELHVPGLRLFGKHSTKKAIPALLPHYHRDCFEFAYLANGSAHFSIEGRSYNLTGGDMFVSCPNQVHDTEAIPISLHTMYWFQLEISDPDRFLFLNRDVAESLISRLSAMPVHVVKVDESATNAVFARVLKLLRDGNRAEREEGAVTLVSLLMHMLNNAEKMQFKLTPDIGRAVNYILDHAEDLITLGLLAEIAMLSESRFKQKFSQEMGMPPREYINHEKVRLARTMLMEGLSVTDVAMNLGFSSSNYFSMVFKRYNRFTPSEYVKMKKSEYRK